MSKLVTAMDKDIDDLIKALRKTSDHPHKDFEIFSKLSEEKLFDRLVVVYCKVFGRNLQVTRDSLFVPTDADTLDKLDLQMEFEEEFAVGLADDFVEKFADKNREYKFTFEQVVGMLQRLPT